MVRPTEVRKSTSHLCEPKVYDELEEITGLERTTIQNYKSISEKTESVRSSPRGEDIGFSHYREVAPLLPTEQEFFLNKASDNYLYFTFYLIDFIYNIRKFV